MGSNEKARFPGRDMAPPSGGVEDRRACWAGATGSPS